MNRFSGLKVITAVFGAALAVSAYAADMSPKKGEPSSVSESAPDQTGMEKKGKAGVPTMPSKGPSSVSESKPGQAGKGPVKGASKDDVKMANPKTPSGVDESSPATTGKEGDGAKKYGKTKSKAKDKDAMAK